MQNRMSMQRCIRAVPYLKGLIILRNGMERNSSATLKYGTEHLYNTLLTII